MAEALLSRTLESLHSIEQQERCCGRSLGSSLIKELTTSLEKLQAVAGDAETRQRRNRQVRDWLERVMDICYELDDLLDDWITMVLKRPVEEGEVGSGGLNQLQLIVQRLAQIVLCSCLCSGCEGRSLVRNLRAVSGKLGHLSREANLYHFTVGSQTADGKDQYSRIASAFIDTTQVWGREEEKRELVRMLVDETSAETTTSPNLQVVSICGIGGIGKTTMAKLCYNDETVESHFDCHIWVSVPLDFDVKYIAKAIIEWQILETQQDVSPDSLELAPLLGLMIRYIQGRKFLLVLDDVWEQDEHKWEPLIAALQSGSRVSKILLTTRNKSVALALKSKHIVQLGSLPMDHSWSIFSQVALQGCNGRGDLFLPDIGRQIVEKFGGVPRIVRSLGGFLRSETSRIEWLQVLQSEWWELDYLITSSLLLSYLDMSPHVRVCFSYCVTFPIGFQIESSKLIRLWMAQGYIKGDLNADLEAVGKAYIHELVMRSLLEVSAAKEDDGVGSETYVKMHDLVHDLAQSCSLENSFSSESDDYDFPSETRHVMLSSERQLHELLDFNKKHNKLRSLLLQSKRSSSGLEMQAELSNLFTQMIVLRSLDLTGCAFRELPPTIRNLSHLRLLILSMNEELEELPEEMCELVNLQTLEANGCKHLRGFPRGMGELVRLRYLGNALGSGNIVYLPKGIGRLIALRTLLEFNIGCHDESASLADLRDLNQLGGDVCINGLGNVTDVSEARKARLQSKTRIIALELNLQREEDRDRICIDEVLLEALQPHANLVELTIKEYRGSKLPSWLSTLSNLCKITLIGCANCESLPDTLSQITSLEELNVYHCPLLEQRYVEQGEDWHTVAHIPKIRITSAPCDRL